MNELLESLISDYRDWPKLEKNCQFQKVGCDLIIDSSARLDACGVCGGDGAFCGQGDTNRWGDYVDWSWPSHEKDLELDVTASSLKHTWHLFWFVNSDIKMSDEQGDANILKVFSQKRKVQFD